MPAPKGNKNAVGNNGGRPPKYNNAKELEEKIHEYFNEGVKVRTVLIGRAPNQTTALIPVPTITGLVIHLGFESRDAFYKYEKKVEFRYTVKKARLFIECEYEEQLQHGNVTGAIFALKNMGWKDKSEHEVTGSQTVIWKEEKTYEANNKADDSA